MSSAGRTECRRAPGQDITKIRELLTHEEPGRQRQGLELAKGLGDWSPVVEGCGIDEDGKVGVPWSVIILSAPPLLGLPRSGTAPAAMLSVLLATARDVLRPRADLVLEVAALRQQLDVL